MKHLFVPYEISLKAKEAGFNEPCLAYHFKNEFLELIYSPFEHSCSNNEFKNSTTTCAAPLYQQLIDWFREKHNIHIEVFVSGNFESWGYGLLLKDCIHPVNESQRNFSSYYQSLNSAINEAFKLIEK